jgi:hypothetical protein
MNRHIMPIVFASALVLGGALATGVVAQTAKDIEGVWTLVSADDVRPDGARHPQFGSKPVGLLVFLPNGVYSLHIAATGQAKFASGNRATATPEEYKAAVVGNFSHWGKWSLDEADHTLIFHVENGMFPNWTDTAQKRRIELSGDELKYLVPNPEAAGANPVIAWKRAK